MASTRAPTWAAAAIAPRARFRLIEGSTSTPERCFDEAASPLSPASRALPPTAPSPLWAGGSDTIAVALAAAMRADAATLHRLDGVYTTDRASSRAPASSIWHYEEMRELASVAPRSCNPLFGLAAAITPVRSISFEDSPSRIVTTPQSRTPRWNATSHRHRFDRTRDVTRSPARVSGTVARFRSARRA